MEWEAFLPHVLPDAKGCPDGEAVYAVIQAAREFCEKTLAWSFECDPILSGAGVKEYVLQLDAGQDLVRVLNVAVGGCDYDVMRGARARSMVRNGHGCKFAYMNGPLSFFLHPTPGIDGIAIVTDIAVKPSLNAEEWPDDLAEYVSDVALGAVARLLNTQGEDWSNPGFGMTKLGEFQDRMNIVKREVERGYSRAARPAVSSWL